MNLEVGKQYNVTVVKILAVGAIVELEDKSTELIHISNIADCYVSDVNDFVSVGKQYVATCEEGAKKPIQLTLKNLGLKPHRQSSHTRSSYKKPISNIRCRSIDDMIADANSQYVEKSSRYEKRNKRR